MTEAGTETIRLDVWLWRARFFKTRGLAASHVSGKGVRLTRGDETRKTVKPGAALRIGDRVTFAKAGSIHTIEIVALGTRRGPAAEAAALYRRVGEHDV